MSMTVSAIVDHLQANPDHPALGVLPFTDTVVREILLYLAIWMNEHPYTGEYDVRRICFQQFNHVNSPSPTDREPS